MTIPSVTPSRVSEPVTGPRASFEAFFAVVNERMGITEAMLLTTLPGARLQLCQRCGSTGRIKLGAADLPEPIESIGWRAVLEGSATETIASGAALMAVRIPGPVFAGYPGVLIVVRAQADSEVLKQAEAEFSKVVLERAPGDIDTASSRQYYFRADGSSVDRSSDQPGAHAARQLLTALDNASGGPNRRLLQARDGRHEAATAARVEPGSPLGRCGVASVVSIYPNSTDWLSLTPAHFAADEELSRLVRAVAFMVEHYHKGPTLANVADAVELSQFHFHRRFTERFGITPKQLLFAVQLGRARQMLADPRSAMSDIASACGFAHQSHFTSRFKQGTAQTPSAWRRQALNRV